MCAKSSDIEEYLDFKSQIPSEISGDLDLARSIIVKPPCHGLAEVIFTDGGLWVYLMRFSSKSKRNIENPLCASHFKCTKEITKNYKGQI